MVKPARIYRRAKNKKPPREVITPRRLKYWYLLINHFNNELQEVKGKVDEFVEISREILLDEYSYENVKSRVK
jgi:hypothetical protein